MRLSVPSVKQFDRLRSAVPFASGMRQAFANGYSVKSFRADLLAGLVVGVVALPLSMALAIAVGVPPQHGLYTAIFAGCAVALTGGSILQVSGPTAAFVIILAPIVSKHGLPGLLTAGLMAGGLLLAMGLFRLGRLIRYIPHPVTTGFTAGIAVVIATLQIRDALGLTIAHMPETYLGKLEALFLARGSVSPVETGLTLLTLIILIGLPRVTRLIPSPLVAITVAALAGQAILQLFPGTEIATIGTRFQYESNGLLLQGIPRILPQPAWPWSGAAPSWEFFRDLIPSAFAIGMLGAIESLLSAVVADSMTRTRHDPNSELIGQGIGNLLVPFFGGIAATGALARTATNIRSGARTPVASIVHSLVILLAILLLAPLIAYIPMAALAGLLLKVAWNMADLRHFRHTLLSAPKSDIFVLLSCFGLTVLFDMVVAVSVGVVLAALLFMRRMADLTETHLVEIEPDMQEPRFKPNGVALIEIAGPLFFGAAEKTVDTLSQIHSGTRAVVFDLGQVPVIDATGLVALESAIDKLYAEKRMVFLAEVMPQPARIFNKAGFRTQYPDLQILPTAQGALEEASRRINQQEQG